MMSDERAEEEYQDWLMHEAEAKGDPDGDEATAHLTKRVAALEAERVVLVKGGIVLADSRNDWKAIAVGERALRKKTAAALEALLGGDEKMQIAIGGNPNYVDTFLAKARALIGSRHDG